ncbi:MAG TPA: DUF1330 domain-containing protein [Sphingomonas sp.]|jgi:uncharacterized protein (DUF1330 family)|uniref:DUF1330 domain-containing protein n=1 Tax=Sphingomonas sp. TaxID=28214 RepID=UPI002ED9C5B3
MVAYVVLTRENTTDQSELDLYAELAPAARTGHPVTTRARYGTIDMLEGDPVEGAVILEFPTMAAARAWYDSPLYQAAAAHRHAGGAYRAFIIEGV